MTSWIVRVGVERKLEGQPWFPVDSFTTTGKDKWTLEEALAWASRGPAEGVPTRVIVVVEYA